MLSLLSRSCHCRTRTRDTLLHIRSFSFTYPTWGKHDKKSTIRIPSKKAAAAKARRKAVIAAAEDAKAEKMTLAKAISVLQAVEVASPKNTYELFIKTEIKSGIAVPKGRVNLPREAKPSSEEKILVFAEGRQAEEARKAGAHIIGGTELVDGIVNGRVQATTILCTPALIKAITPKLGRILGPLGLMPSERRGTVTDDIAGYLQRIQGTSEWRADKAGNIRTPIALLHFPVEDVVQNIRHFLASVKKVTGNTRDAEARRMKGSGPRPVTTISKVMLSSTQGPGIRISDF
ncbi:hypothetical protein AGABI1DRAFT_81729 [Agaricus bisporus var. burnettii JB137-S8]|uniref:Ribosomal protein n=2 Tax=Agaricus bisporus var. burnettii TaxID=192524 RepID=K5XKD7_AGABU|nr:uncharacterized protein AGABI1DRAFT_81729 [Agaricus bisporus var. burnettii JB137-S8]EKM83998.1 hypothetical protein AGABI1DRAFT_81729 [Agaricus bisporus var. burnettii JB137-S8]KAF7784198.1 hypothetical protein Agabi119p4_363 [Agaricus bisporus var. burnettii]